MPIMGYWGRVRVFKGCGVANLMLGLVGGSRRRLEKRGRRGGAMMIG